MLKNFGAINKITAQFVLPEFANKNDFYECPDPECKKDLIFKDGKKRKKHFSHKPFYDKPSIKDCDYYERPGESQIHLNAKLYLKKLFEDSINSNTNIEITTKCSCGQSNSIPLYLNDTKIVLEHRFKFLDLDKIADIACLFTPQSNIKYIFEICYKHKTKNDTRPEPWFEIDAKELLTSDYSWGFDEEKKLINKKITLNCSRLHKICEKCKCKGYGKCMQRHSHKKLYDCEFNCKPIKCKNDDCDTLINSYYDSVKDGCCFVCTEKREIHEKYEKEKLRLKSLLETKDCPIFVEYECECKNKGELKLDFLDHKNTKILIDYLDRDVSMVVDEEIKYVFDLFYKYKPPKVFYNHLTEFQLGVLNNFSSSSKSSLYFDQELKKLVPKTTFQKITLNSINKLKYCNNCKCTGNGKCLEIDTHTPIYDCEFKCKPIKCKYETCNKMIVPYHNNKNDEYCIVCLYKCKGNGVCLYQDKFINRTYECIYKCSGVKCKSCLSVFPEIEISEGVCEKCNIQLLIKFNLRNGEKIYLDVLYNQKEKAKSMGAKWDPDFKLWYVSNEKGHKFEKSILKIFGVRIDMLKKDK